MFLPLILPIIICTQNLARCDIKSQTTCRGLLNQRFQTAGCDIIAVQELPAGTTPETNLMVGETTDSVQPHVGFIIKNSEIKILKSFIPKEDQVPPLNSNSPPVKWLRKPFGILIEYKSQKIFLVTFHLKSKSGGQNDPAGLKWELIRIAQAKEFKIWLHKEVLAQITDSIPVIVLGDKNTIIESATEKILTGEINPSTDILSNCDIAKSTKVYCKFLDLPEFFPITSFMSWEQKLQGSFEFNKHNEWIDEILLSGNAFKSAVLSVEDKYGKFNPIVDAGVVAEPKDASDHKLVWVRLGL